MSSSNGSSCRGHTLLEVLVTLAVVALIVSLALPAVQQAREASRRLQCQSNLRTWALALHAYHNVHGTLPPGQIVEIPGRPIASNETNRGGFSHYVLLLPYVEAYSIYDRINFSLGWSHHKNLEARSRRLHLLECPSQDPVPRGVGDFQSYATHYAACGGSGAWTGFPDGAFLMGRGRRLNEFARGLSKTAVLSEWRCRRQGSVGGVRSLPQAPANREDVVAICHAEGAHGDSEPLGSEWLWGMFGETLYTHVMPPNSSSCRFSGVWSHREAYTASSLHPGGLNIAIADGSVSFLTDQVDLTTWRQWARIADSEL